MKTKKNEILSIEYFLKLDKDKDHDKDMNNEYDIYKYEDHKLSPGEYLILLIQLWIMHANKISVPKMRKKLRILLLDEPDVHMHPRLIENFINLILI